MSPLLQYLATLLLPPAIGGAVLAIFWVGRKLINGEVHP